MADGLVDAVVATSTARVEGLTLDSVISGLQPMAATAVVPTVGSTASATLTSEASATGAAPAPTVEGEGAAGQVVAALMAATAAAVAPTVTAASVISGLSAATGTGAGIAPTVTGGGGSDGLVTSVVAAAASASPEAAISADQNVTGSDIAEAVTVAVAPDSVVGLNSGDALVASGTLPASTAAPVPTVTGQRVVTVTVPAPAAATSAFPEPEAAGAVGDDFNTVSPTLASAADLVNPVPVVAVTPFAWPAVASMGDTDSGTAPTIHASVNLYPPALHMVSRVRIPRLRPYSIDGHADDPNVRWVHLYEMTVPVPGGNPDTETLRWTDDALPVYYLGNKFFSYVVAVDGVTTEHGQIASATLTVGNANNLFGNYAFAVDLTGSVVDIWQGWLDPDRPTQLCEAAWKIFHGRVVGISLSRSGADSEARLTLGPYADPATKMFPPRTVTSLIRG